eukprot:TRINITY_DN30280_c0_g1_i2.p1 TRINITY_DN30280_c0_g1~~TRINITY_DN30280_c0_g1_i2.p1  ORF type:complete len:183 (-),score=36.05 TRINITY_DN30280_c0_g1_i2:6-554(-)
MCPILSKDKKKTINMQIWDTAGQEMFRAIAPMYYKDADGVLLVYNVTDAASFKALGYWLEEVKEKAQPDVFVIVAGNQSDRIEDEVIDPQMGKAFAERHGAGFFLCSAKLGQNIKEIFAEFVERRFPGFLSGNNSEGAPLPVQEEKKLPTEEEHSVRPSFRIRPEAHQEKNEGKKCACQSYS